MRILINGAACEGWGRKEDNDVRFSKHVGPSEGRVLSAEEAKAAAERASAGQREKLVLWSVAIFLFVVVYAAIIGGVEESPAPKVLGAMLVAALTVALLVGVNLWSIGARAKEWRARLAGGRLWPAGAAVTFDETAFTLDNAVTPWTSLTVERLIVVMTGGEDTTNYHVERIEATDGDRTQLFDLYLYSNGEALVRMAYLKLIRERLPVLKH
jgi:hypothetical protein